MSQAIERLIFIYNANSGLASAISDSAKKLFKLKACGLCTITHGLLKEKQEWKNCESELNLPIDYFHKDDYPNDLKEIVKDKLPCILAKTTPKPIILLNDEEINSCAGDVANLETKLKESLEKNNLSY
ncbi:MAG: hypothetical protein HY819_14275 [Acidobacteria bacterium]|nr:hypothetical protein [Acidobacteriota bacterium]